MTDNVDFTIPILPGSNDSSVGLMLWNYDGSRWAAVANLRYVTDVAPAGPNEAWAIAHVHGTNATIAVPPRAAKSYRG